MGTRRRWAVAVVVTLALDAGLAACGEETAAGGQAAANPESEQQQDAPGDGGREGRVTLTEAAVRAARIEVEPARQEPNAESSSEGWIPAQVELDPARVALVSPRAPGRIERLTVVEGDAVRRGQAVAYLLSTPFLTAQSDFLQAARRARLLQGTADEDGAQTLVEAAARRLGLLGAEETLIQRLAEGGVPEDLLPVAAPLDGRVIEAHALSGAAVEPGSPIFTVADLSVVNVAAQVPEVSLPRLLQGQSVAVRLIAYPGLRLTGRVSRVKETLDRETRTATALIEVQNRDGVLRPGMFASVALEAPGGGNHGARATVVPASAVVTDGTERYVFVEVGERTYERRDVDVAPPPGEGGLVVVLSGVAPGERVVVRGAFTLKAELTKGAFGEHED